ncbi:MAG TPA: pyruvate, phosphate dikinase [Gaiellaceae bacterium]|jgi:pyruvate,orthophosphate dikinase|nr:pyruvate, phosphate dikinase [Gaiellaceae bacterium]
MTTDEKYVYDFDEPCEGGRALLGGKGLGLAEMTQLGLPVPHGFTITTAACRATISAGAEPAGLADEIEEHLRRLEEATGKRFGDPERPLLLSVRSGGPISMPGMMETVLDLGLNRAVVEGLCRSVGARFAYDAFRRLIQMYGAVVDGVEASAFEDAIELLKRERGVESDAQLTATDFLRLAWRFQEIYTEQAGRTFPADPREQLTRAIRAVFASWNAPRAQVYRREYGISDELGTGVNVMEMVFGNRDARSATGVCFSRDPATGARGLYGEFLVDAQGEDVVAGTRTPQSIESLADEFPAADAELRAAVDELERHYRDVQDVEFTIEHDRLYLLQTRGAKRTAAAALACAVAFVDEGLIDELEAVRRIDPASLDQLLHPTFDPRAQFEVVATGLAASPGAASGHAVFDADRAAERGAAGEAVILVRPETTADDIHGLIASRGVLTARGGMTSHAAVVARGIGKPCVAGCAALEIDLDRRTAQIAGATLREGDTVTVDGTTGRVVLGAVPLVEPAPNADLDVVLGWADRFRALDVRANADTPPDAARARANGAEGIGLCRTEHMFMAGERLPVVREMILAESAEERAAALARLLPMQQSDFEGLFEAMGELPVTIRLLDPPLHEFLPALDEVPDARTRDRIAALHEANPMLGTRGCRLGLERPEIYEMQIRAIVRAAHAVRERTGTAPVVEIMHPLVAFSEELERLGELTRRVVAEEGGLDYRCGTMIELPRAALRAGELARHADFFSFGTNDLTQTTLGFSRDDAQGRFLTYYLEHGILASDPFATLDVEGVGELVRLAVERGRAANDRLHVGICGEHGGDPASIAFCHSIGIDYVSCSPFRIPVARLAAAQAAIASRVPDAYVPAGG